MEGKEEEDCNNDDIEYYLVFHSPFCLRSFLPLCLLHLILPLLLFLFLYCKIAVREVETAAHFLPVLSTKLASSPDGPKKISLLQLLN